MDAHAALHPTDQTLRSYGLGKLDDIRATAVNDHLEKCPDCRNRVAEMSADSFLGRIRDAQRPTGRSMFGEARPGVTERDQSTDAVVPPSPGTIPPSLAGHPDYQIKRELGRGGMGVVYLAHNRLMARDEVLKVMGQQFVEQPGVLDRFLREIRAVARLRHPNIVSAYTAFRCGESLVFAMEYVAGLDLARMVKAKGPMPVGNACNYVHQAALGLQHAHEEGMVHRDIKPGNLMLSYKGNRAVIKVLDFGLAKATREQHAGDVHHDESIVQGDWVASVTRTGQMLGTPDFIAPEQIVDAQKADIRADIYSLGCTLYCLLSGRAPFHATPHDVLQAHRLMDARLLDVVRPEVPAELAALVAKMMAKEPDQRFQEPDEVAEALSPYFKKRSAILVPQETRPSRQDGLAEVAAAVQPGRTGLRWRRAALASAIGFAAILLGALVAYRTVTDTLKQGQKSVGRVHPETLRPPSPVATPKSEQFPPLVLAGPKAEQVSPTKQDEKPAVAPPREATPPAAAAAVETAQAPVPTPKPATPSEVRRDQIAATWRRLSPFDEQVNRAKQAGTEFLKKDQRPDGSWLEVDHRFKTATTSLATLALLAAGERPDSPKIHGALDYLRAFSPFQLNTTYEIALQTMVFAAAEPRLDQVRIAANANWLEGAQIRHGDPVSWPGSWGHTYSEQNPQPGDSLNSRWALLGLRAAHEAGATVKAEVVDLARIYWESCQKDDGSWGNNPNDPASSASMTCAGTSSLIIMGSTRNGGGEFLQGETIQNCGKGGFNPRVARGLKWLDDHWPAGEDRREGQNHKNYYLYELERVGSLSGVGSFGRVDWYRPFAEMLVNQQSKPFGSWRGFNQEHDAAATSFALCYLGNRSGAILINKLRHGPRDDWNNDAVDIQNLVRAVSREWKAPLISQVVDPDQATVQDLLRAPVVFFNGHYAPSFSAVAKRNLRDSVEQGAFLFAEACCGSKEFDQGFKVLMTEVFPEPEYKLRPLSEDHPVWRSKHLLSPDIHPLWGIEHGCRTVVIYSPMDLSCYWNQSERLPTNTGVIKALKVGQNVIEYVTGRGISVDKPTVPDVSNFKAGTFKKGAFRVAKLKHAGDWNIAPQAIPNLTDVLRKPPNGFEVVITQKELDPRDPNLVYYPLIYIHGRAALPFSREDLDALRQHVESGGATIFADAACGSPAFDAAFRRFVADLLPKDPMIPIPHADELYTVGADLRDVQYTRAAGGGRDYPQLEGVKIKDHWSIIYSKYDIGCALDLHANIECKGYTYESAIKIAGNIVIYSALP